MDHLNADSTTTPAKPLVKWLRPPDSSNPRDTKVTIAYECCKSACLAMNDSGADYAKE